MAFPTKFGQLCTPAQFYLVISVFGILLTMFQNFGNNGRYSLGMFSCRVPSTMLVFLVQIIYILFWTWILNLICKDGYVGISWFLVLLPFILLFLLVGLMMVYEKEEDKQQKIKINIGKF
jgi:hypothetical protein